MNLTTAQQAALKTDINARANLTAFVTAMDWPSIAAFYNGNASPTVNVWKTSVSEAAIKSGVAWQTFLGLTLQLQTAYLAMTQDGFIDATDKGTMHGLVGLASAPTDGVFPDGTPSSVNIRALCIRPASFFESLFSALGTGTLSTSNICQNDALGNSLFGQSLDAATVQHVMGF